MRRRAAAALLCGPLLAGCGAATRVRFAGHRRPASAAQVSVLVTSSGLTLEPSRLRPGLVVFDITNQTAHAARYSVRARGRALARTPLIAPGQTAQLKARLSGGGETFTSFSHTSPRGTLERGVDLTVSGSTRSGDDELTQP